MDLKTLTARVLALPGMDVVRAAAERAQVRAYVVGGAIRDAARGESRSDLDVVVEGVVESGDGVKSGVEALAAELGGETVSHERFSTATVRTGGLTLDLATARTESYPEPGALPEVKPSTLDEDLARRDFTINAMAVGLGGDARLVDPHGGLADIGAGVLRALHERSFTDDPTRALRAARYAARLGFELEGQTEARLKAADLSTVSEDRITAELRLIAAERDPAKAIAVLEGWQILELNQGAADLARKALELLGGPPWEGFVEREPALLLASRGDLSEASELARISPRSPAEAAMAARGHSPATLAVAHALGGEWLDRYVDEWRHVELEIEGSDLLEAGIEEGPAVGRGLGAALSAKLDGRASGREQELAVALEAARGGS